MPGSAIFHPLDESIVRHLRFVGFQEQRHAGNHHGAERFGIAVPCRFQQVQHTPERFVSQRMVALDNLAGDVDSVRPLDVFVQHPDEARLLNLVVDVGNMGIAPGLEQGVEGLSERHALFVEVAEIAQVGLVLIRQPLKNQTDDRPVRSVVHSPDCEYAVLPVDDVELPVAFADHHRLQKLVHPVGNQPLDAAFADAALVGQPGSQAAAHDFHDFSGIFENRRGRSVSADRVVSFAHVVFNSPSQISNNLPLTSG